MPYDSLPVPQCERYAIDFDGKDDPEHPQNWKTRTKLTISAVLVLDSFGATFASSVFTTAQSLVQKEFNMGSEVVTLGTSLFVLGYALGPIIWAPLSEVYGRLPPIVAAAFGFGVFNIAVAVAKDFQTILICRFFAGVFGACPVTIVAAVFADMYNHEWRGIAVIMFSAAVICGPLTGPIIGGFISKSCLGWRWTSYIPAFLAFTSCVLSNLLQKESLAPVILVRKARRLRHATGNWCLYATQEKIEVTAHDLVTKHVSRPLRILFTEPIVLLITLYTSFIYGLLYLSFSAYDIIFDETYGMTPGMAGLPYLAVIIGVFAAAALITLTNKDYARKLNANSNVPVPEWRLPIVIVGGPIFAIGLFWLGWTGYTGHIHWMAPTASGIFIGFGIFTIFLPCLNYIIDAYLIHAASAIAANTIMRSLFGAIFPLFSTEMFNGMGIQWGMTLLGCVATLFVPVPIAFYYRGKAIRGRSSLVPSPREAEGTEA